MWFREYVEENNSPSVLFDGLSGWHKSFDGLKLNLLGGIEFCDIELHFWNEGTLFSKKS